MKNKEYGIALNWNYIIVSVIITAIFTLFVLYFPGMRELDGNILHSIRLALSPYPAYIPNFINGFGREYYMFWPQLAVVSTLLAERRFMKAFIFVLLVQVTYFVSNLFQNFVCRECPAGHGGFSFPSVHSATTMCLYGIVVYLILHYVRNDFWRNFLAIFFGLWIFLCGLSQIWLGSQFLSDVITGMFVGFIFVNLYIIITKSLSR